MFQTKVAEKIKTHFVFNNFFYENRAFYVIMWKNIGQITDDNMAHAHCMLDNSSYRETLRMCNTYFFSTATMVTRTSFYVILYVHFLPCISQRHYNTTVSVK